MRLKHPTPANNSNCTIFIDRKLKSISKQRQMQRTIFPSFCFRFICCASLHFHRMWITSVIQLESEVHISHLLFQWAPIFRDPFVLRELKSLRKNIVSSFLSRLVGRGLIIRRLKVHRKSWSHLYCSLMRLCDVFQLARASLSYLKKRLLGAIVNASTGFIFDWQ